MSQFVSHFKFDDDSSIIWSMCVITGCCLVMVSLYFFSLVIQHLYCIPDADYSQTEPRRARRYSFLSVTFATLCVLFTFATYPVCDQLWCGYNLLGFFTFVLVLDSYIFSKFFLYLIFIGRLFNPYYRCIYQYPKWMQYSLQTLLTVMMISVLIGNINNGLHNTSIERMWCAIYVITDLTISIATTFLFFRPIFFDRTKSSIYSNIDLSVVKRYGIVSVLQLLAAVTFELSFLGRIYGGALHALQGVWSSYLDICSVVQMIDCLLLIICIHRGFARKDTTRNAFTICSLFFVWCCCACCGSCEFEEDENSALERQEKQQVKDKSIDKTYCEDVSMQIVSHQISRTPNITYLNEEPQIHVILPAEE